MPQSPTPSVSVKRARRPSIPPILTLSLAFWATAALAYWLERDATTSLCIACAVLGLAATLVCFILLVKRFPHGICILCGIALGCVAASTGAALLHANIDEIDADSAGTCYALLRCDEDAKQGSYSITCAATIVEGTHKGSRVRMRFDDANTLPLAGTLIEAQVRYTSASDTSRDYFWREGLAGTAIVTDWHARDTSAFPHFIRALRAAAITHIESFNMTTFLAQTGASDEDIQDNVINARDVLAALVCGYRVDLSGSEIYENYKQAGLAHLIAVSGAHLSIVVALVGSMLDALRCPRRLARILQLFSIGTFLVIAGIPTSAVRAAIMAVCSMLAAYSKRRPAALNAFGVCVVCMIGLSPRTAVSVSFALSAGSTLGIILFAPLFITWLRALLPRLPYAVCESLALTLTSSLCTLPFSSALFSQLSLVAPLSNVLVGPLFAIMCPTVVFLVVAACVISPIRSLCLLGAIALSDVLNEVTSLLAAVPFSCIPCDGNVVIAIVASSAACVLLWWSWPSAKALRRSLLPITIALSTLALGMCLVILPSTWDDRIVALDVGQGDAILLRSRACTCLIDTGNQDDLLKQALARNHVYHLDTLIISHADDDHCGSLATLGAVVSVDKVLVATDMTRSTSASCTSFMETCMEVFPETPIVCVNPGDTFTCGNFCLNVVWPDTYHDSGGNADSLCVLATWTGGSSSPRTVSALFCGDAESEQLNTMVSQRRIAHVDILKVGHHGSKAALDTRAISALNPRIALISVGEGNDYGHPHAQTLSLLENVGTVIYRTDQQGDLTCVIKRNGIHVSTQK